MTSEKTMISVGFWKSLIKKTLEQISDENYQRLAWFGKHPTDISSPDEELITLLDDYVFEESFIDSPRINLTPSQKQSAHDFCKIFEGYYEGAPMFLDPAKVIDDPHWEHIRQEAKKLIPILFPDEDSTEISDDSKSINDTH